MLKRSVFSRISAVIFTVVLLTNIAVYARSQATIYSADNLKATLDEQIVDVQIKNNVGIMGFRLHFEYNGQEIEIVSVSRGQITASGNFQDNVGLKQNMFDILWNNTADVSGDGTVAIIKLRLLTEKPCKIDISYIQPDTFNEKWQDVVLSCESVFSENYVFNEDVEDETPSETTSKDQADASFAEDTSIRQESTDSSQKPEKDSYGTSSGDISSTYKETSDDSSAKEKSDLKQELKDAIAMLIPGDSPAEVITEILDNIGANQIDGETTQKISDQLVEGGISQEYFEKLETEDLQPFYEELVAEEENENTYIKDNQIIICLIVVLSCLVVILAAIIILRGKKSEK